MASNHDVTMYVIVNVCSCLCSIQHTRPHLLYCFCCYTDVLSAFCSLLHSLSLRYPTILLTLTLPLLALSLSFTHAEWHKPSPPYTQPQSNTTSSTWSASCSTWRPSRTVVELGRAAPPWTWFHRRASSRMPRQRWWLGWTTAAPRRCKCWRCSSRTRYWRAT